jgi:hypothetical protein
MSTQTRSLSLVAGAATLLVVGFGIMGPAGAESAPAIGVFSTPVRSLSKDIEFDAGNGMDISGHVALSSGLQTADGRATPVRALAHYLVFRVDGAEKGGFSGIPLVEGDSGEPYERTVFQLAARPGEEPLPGALSFHIRLTIKPRGGLAWGQVISRDDLLVETVLTRDIGMTVPRGR